MESTNPFSRSFEVLGQQCGSTLDGINKEAFDELKAIAQSIGKTDLGQQVLLKSPRAGFGKTHLLARLKSHLNEWNFFALSPIGGTALTAISVTEDIVGDYLKALPAGGGLTALDLLARQLLALALDPLVTAGDVPCQDRDSALAALRKRPIETFDFHAEDALTAQWTLDNFQLLGPRLALELANKAGCSHRDAIFWVNLFFEYSSTAPTDPLRNSHLTTAINRASQEASETIRMERLSALINLITLLAPTTLVLDETEGFSSNPVSALGLATFFQSLRQSCPKLLLILALNSDIWETAFLPRLSGGLKDRLCETIVELQPLTPEQVSSLVDELGGSHARVINKDLEDLQGVLYARRIMKEAARIWQREEASAPQNNNPQSPSAIAAPDSQELSRPIVLTTPQQEDEFVPKVEIREKEKSDSGKTISKVIPDGPTTDAPPLEAELAPLEDDITDEETESPASDAGDPKSDTPAVVDSKSSDDSFNPVEVSDDDQKKVDDLLKKFRERYSID